MRTLSWLIAATSLALAFVGCGSSKSGSSNKMQDSGVDSGSSAPSAMKPRDAGGSKADGSTTASGSLMEGDQCDTAADCMKGLICALGSNGSVSASFCARGCMSDSDCGSERCYSQTNNAADAHCVNVVRQEFATCGLAETSVCGQPLTCLYGQTAALGICITLCDLPTGDDAGAAGAGCSADQNCLSNIVDSKTQGICGKNAKRGEVCNVDMGIFCGDTADICAPDDPTDMNSATHCYEDCTDTSKCSSGKCTSLHSIAYCK